MDCCFRPGEAYRLIEVFLDVFDMKESEKAKGYLWFWYERALGSVILPFAKFANVIKVHWIGITAYFDKRVTDGMLESINSKIQLAKRWTRG
jgi:transposase